MSRYGFLQNTENNAYWVPDPGYGTTPYIADAGRFDVDNHQHKQLINYLIEVGRLRFIPIGHLPDSAKERKAIPLATGLIDYFPDALIAVAELSRIGNDQHNPGQPLHWAREKSTDEDDALMRHFVDRGKKDTDNVRHRTKVAWRALAALQKEIEAEQGLEKKG